MDNPPAFPSYSPDESPFNHGMTLRDWFATHAIGMGFDWVNVHETGGYEEAAIVAYEIADAMLLARAKGPSHD